MWALLPGNMSTKVCSEIFPFLKVQCSVFLKTFYRSEMSRLFFFFPLDFFLSLTSWILKKHWFVVHLKRQGSDFQYASFVASFCHCCSYFSC